MVVKMKEKENALHCVYLNVFNMVTAAFVLQCTEAKNWFDGINKARNIYTKLKQDFLLDGNSDKAFQQQQGSVNNVSDSFGIRKSPLGSSIGKTHKFSCL